MDNFYFKKNKFIKSCIDIKDSPEVKLPEILFVGKSNVGKSSLINGLTNNTKLAYTSSKPGHTRLLNYFLIDEKFYFVDCPGYGFSSKKDLDYIHYAKMIDGYFEDNNNLKLVVFLLDSRHLPTDDDEDFYEFLKSKNYKYIFCFTKCDKLNQSEKSKIIKNLALKFGEESLKNKSLYVSIKDKNSLLQLKNYIMKILHIGD